MSRCAPRRVLAVVVVKLFLELVPGGAVRDLERYGREETHNKVMHCDRKHDDQQCSLVFQALGISLLLTSPVELKGDSLNQLLS